MFEASLDFSEFHKAVKETKTQLYVARNRAVAGAALEGAAHARAVGQYKDRTGTLRSGIVARFLSTAEYSVVWEILSAAPYSRYVEEGTQAHDIWPKAQNGYSGPTRRGQTRRADNDVGVGRGHALRWKSGGKTIFAAMVHHPGSKPYPYAGPGLLKAEAVIYREFDLMFGLIARIWN